MSIIYLCCDILCLLNLLGTNTHILNHPTTYSLSLKQSTVEQRVSVTRQLNDTQNELRTAKHRSKEQEQEIAALNHRVTDLLRRIAVDGENMRQAVEKAVSASVRLCVVAPTVNVQVAESKRMRFKSE